MIKPNQSFNVSDIFKILTMKRTLSVCSFTSDQLEGQEDDVLDLDFDVAPYDIFGAHESVGSILVARKGDWSSLPCMILAGVVSPVPY